MKKVVLSKDIILIENFWSVEKCMNTLLNLKIKDMKLRPFRQIMGPVLSIIFAITIEFLYKDLTLAQGLWKELEPYAPKSIGDSEAIGLNELFRFHRYQPGQQFRKHRDQSYIRNSQESSYFTFMIYLNDGFKGGETKFSNLVVAPTKGTALIFYHYLEHEGTEVTEGIKYVLRTDIMFRLQNSGK